MNQGGRCEGTKPDIGFCETPDCCKIWYKVTSMTLYIQLVMEIHRRYFATILVMNFIAQFTSSFNKARFKSFKNRSSKILRGQAFTRDWRWTCSCLGNRGPPEWLVAEERDHNRWLPRNNRGCSDIGGTVMHDTRGMFKEPFVRDLTEDEDLLRRLERLWQISSFS